MTINDQLSIQDGFSDVEKVIADYILSVKDRIKGESARYIAGQIYTSPASITRLCQRLGYEGYNDFREAYLQELEYLNSHFQSIDPNFPFVQKDSPMKVAHKISSLYKEIIEDTLSLITMEQLHRVIALMEKAKIIYIVSAGNHVHMAYPFKEKMMKIGKRVEILSQSDMAYFQAGIAGKEDCFIFISYSGEISNNIRIANRAREEGAATICFTSYGNNSLSDICQECLFVSTREKLLSNLGTYGVYLAALYLFDVLYSIYFNRNYQKNLATRIGLSNDFEKLRNSDNPVLQEIKD